LGVLRAANLMFEAEIRSDPAAIAHLHPHLRQLLCPAQMFHRDVRQLVGQRESARPRIAPHTASPLLGAQRPDDGGRSRRAEGVDRFGLAARFRTDRAG